MLVARRASCGVANAFSTRLKLIWLLAWKPPKCPKNAFFEKSWRSGLLFLHRVLQWTWPLCSDYLMSDAFYTEGKKILPPQYTQARTLQFVDRRMWSCFPANCDGTFPYYFLSTLILLCSSVVMSVQFLCMQSMWTFEKGKSGNRLAISAIWPWSDVLSEWLWDFAERVCWWLGKWLWLFWSCLWRC